MGAATRTGEISQYIRRKALLYLPDLDKSHYNVLLTNFDRRSTSTIYRFEVSDNSKKYVLLVKAQGAEVEAKCQPLERPRLSPWSESIRKEGLWYEYKGLLALQCHFEKLGDPRFGAVQVYDFLPDLQAFIMLEVHATSLRSLLYKSSRLRSPFKPAADLTLAFFNCGAWLRISSMLENDYATPLHTHRLNYIESINDLSEYITKATGYTSFFREHIRVIVKNALQEMPDELPLALGHGDFAARNILVGPGDQVTVFDTCPRWYVPVYEDIAYFLTALETNWFQVVTQGWAFEGKQLDGYERAFLKGYFDQCHIPDKIIHLFKIKILLDKWAAHISRIKDISGNSQMKHKKIRFILLNRHYHNYMKYLLQKLGPLS